MSVNISGVQPDQSAFSPALKQWLFLNEKFFAEEQDVSWRYSELTDISFLSGAIWTLNGCALSEFSTKKEINQTKSGKADFY